MPDMGFLLLPIWPGLDRLSGRLAALGSLTKTPIVPFPRSYKSLKMLCPLGSMAGKFILTSGCAPFGLSVASQSVLCACWFLCSVTQISRPESVQAPRKDSYAFRENGNLSLKLLSELPSKVLRIFASPFLYHGKGY